MLSYILFEWICIKKQETNSFGCFFLVDTNPQYNLWTARLSVPISHVLYYFQCHFSHVFFKMKLGFGNQTGLSGISPGQSHVVLDPLTFPSPLGLVVWTTSLNISDTIVSFVNPHFTHSYKKCTILTNKRGGLCHSLQQGPVEEESWVDLNWRSQDPECSVSLPFHNRARDTSEWVDCSPQMPVSRRNLAVLMLFSSFWT